MVYGIYMYMVVRHAKSAPHMYRVSASQPHIDTASRSFPTHNIDYTFAGNGERQRSSSAMSLAGLTCQRRQRARFVRSPIRKAVHGLAPCGQEFVYPCVSSNRLVSCQTAWSRLGEDVDTGTEQHPDDGTPDMFMRLFREAVIIHCHPRCVDLHCAHW